MPLSYPPIHPVQIPGAVTMWNATCRTCGHDVCTHPQLYKATVRDARRAHGPEARCTRTPKTPNREVGSPS